MIKQQITMAEILHTAVGPQAVDKPSTVAVIGQSLDFDVCVLTILENLPTPTTTPALPHLSPT